MQVRIVDIKVTNVLKLAPYIMKLLLVKPVIKLGESKFPENGTGERKYIYRLHLFAFYIYLTYFNK